MAKNSVVLKFDLAFQEAVISMIASFFVYAKNPNFLISFHRGNWNREKF